MRRRKETLEIFFPYKKSQQRTRLKNERGQPFHQKTGGGQQVGQQKKRVKIPFFVLCINEHKRRESQPRKAEVNQPEHAVVNQNAPAGNKKKCVEKGKLNIEKTAAEPIDRRRKTQETKDRSGAARRLRKLPEEIKPQQQKPVVKRRFVIVRFAVEGRHEVVAREVHF